MTRPTFRPLRLAGLAAAVVPAAACLKSDSTSPRQRFTLAITADNTLSGTAGEDANGVFIRHGVLSYVGDEGATVTDRAVFAFNLSQIPANATILSALFEVQAANLQGDPYALGNVVLDHVDYGSTLDASTFDPTVLEGNIATLSTSVAGGVKTANVAVELAEDLESERTHSEYRARFTPTENNGDDAFDRTGFSGAEILVTYGTP